jgi:hypothetical protein
MHHLIKSLSRYTTTTGTVSVQFNLLVDVTGARSTDGIAVHRRLTEEKAPHGRFIRHSIYDPCR